MTADDLAAALATPEMQPAAALDAVGRLAEAVTGARLVTLMIHDPDDDSSERIWSNMPDAYPVSGRKPANHTHWSEIVIDRQETFVANSIAEVAAVFDDHPLIRSLGCESCMNLPIIVAGQVLGTVNCLDAAGYWTPERVAAARALLVPGAAAYLLHRQTAKESAQ
ncbi:MAG: GAF domain-containing protein [Rubellimicrobium sp.]|nr:GAF domain-containing protein [Rubellimicrobium sp.]